MGNQTSDLQNENVYEYRTKGKRHHIGHVSFEYNNKSQTLKKEFYN